MGSPYLICVLQREHKEIRIAVPWGHIAAREWGDASSLTKVLCLHGWQDNANSFEPLVQYFPPGFHVVAIDFPGHGLSSHLPLGMAYNFSDWVVHVRRVTKDLQWKHCHIVAHSMGASVAMLYSGTFPEAVESLVCFDSSSPIIPRVENGPDRLHEAADQIVKYDHEHYGLYDFEETVQRYIKSTFGSVTRESGVLLMERGTTADGQGKVRLNRDFRLKIKTQHTFSLEQYSEFARRIRAPFLAIGATETPYKQVLNAHRDVFFQIYERNLPRFEVRDFKGPHHFHMNNADKVAPLVVSFLEGKPLPSAEGIIEVVPTWRKVDEKKGSSL